MDRMRYEAYQNKISAIANVLRTVIAHWPLFLLQFVILAGVLTAFFATKGTVISITCAESIPYGDTIECKTVALFSKTYLEYKTESEEEWTTEAPVMPGEYQLRAVGKGFFGNKVSDAVSFTIEKRAISVHTANGTVNYGEDPVLTANLAYDDVLTCTKFEASDIFTKQNDVAAYVAVTPQKNAITITNAAGADVTAAYIINTEREELKIIPREITVTVQNASKTYDGMAFTFDGYELSGGTLTVGDSLFAYFTKSIVDVGSIENTPDLILVNKNGTDVTVCYTINVIEGMLTVEKRPLIVRTSDGEFKYDTNPHTSEEYEISTDTPLVENQELSLHWSGQTEAGEYPNIPSSFIVTDENDVDKTHNYAFFFEAGTLKINPIPISVTTPSKIITYQGAQQKFSYFGLAIPTGSGNISGILDGHQYTIADSSVAIDVGNYENDTTIKIHNKITGEDVTHNYDITYHRGTISIQKLSITITTASGEWTYDGTTHYKREFTSGFVGYNDKIVVTDATPAKDAGTYTNVLAVKIVREAPKQEGGDDEVGAPDEDEIEIDASHNYSINYIYGTLAITQRSITFKPTDASKVYDGTPLTSTTLQVAPKSENALPLGHSVFASQTGGSLTDVGTLTNYIVPSSIVLHDSNGQNVTSNYDIRLSVGLLTVSPRNIHVQTDGAVKKYDGTPLSNTSFAIVTDEYDTLVEGHIINVENIGSISRVGKTENICHLDKTHIFDKNGKDVTNNYRISYTYGILEVYDSTNELYSGGFNESGAIGSFKAELASLANGSSVDLPSLLKVKDARNGYVYLRLKSFGGYAGNAWYEATEYPELLLGKYSANYLTSLALSSSAMELSVIAKAPYFFMPYYASVTGAQGNTLQSGDVFYSGIDSTELESFYTVSYKDYDYSTKIALPEEYAAFEEAYRAFVYSQYLILDDESRTYMEDIIEAEKLFGTDIESILNAARYIQNSAIYNIDYEPSLDKEANVAIAFLESYGEGISQHFASALTLLYRAMGIPARYTVGFATSTVKDQWVEVDRSRVHAWVEVYIDGVGWIEIEATGGSDFGLNGSGGKPKKQEIVIKPVYRAKGYDGKPLYPSALIEYDPTLAHLAEQGCFWSVRFSGSIDQVGRAESIPTEFILYDSSGNDITDQYNIVLEHGVLEIFDSAAIVIEIKLSRLQKYYDRTPLSFSETDYAITSNTNLDGIDISVHLPSLTDADYLTLSELNENIEKYVSVSIASSRPNKKVVVVFTEYSSSVLTSAMVEPILKISRKNLTVVASSASKLYDGKPLTSNSAYIAQGSLAEGHKMSVTVKGSLIEYGTAENQIVRVIITDENGEDVTMNYAIIPVNGTLMVFGDAKG